MIITYNNVEAPSDMVTLSEIPNILTIKDQELGTKAEIDLDFEGNLQQMVTGDGQFYIEMFGETITSTINPQMNNNKRFYISTDEDATAMNVARALRNCGGINAEFNVIHSGPSVLLRARTIGAKWSNVDDTIKHNVPDTKLTVSVMNGHADNELYGAKIDVDVYLKDTEPSNYVTTLEKNYYGSECSFNMSPLLSTLSAYGSSKKYILDLSAVKSTSEYSWLGTVSAHTIVGYSANDSEKKLNLGNVMKILQNKKDNMLFYTYSNVINYSVLRGVNGWSTFYSVKDSAGQEIYSYNFTNRNYGNNVLLDRVAEIPPYAFNRGFYIDITEGVDTIRYNIIKPLKATEKSQRIFWRNEYGGIQFFDFTGQITYDDKIENETYEKNVFDYQSNDAFESKKVYSNEFDKTVTLTSHLMEEGGKYQFESLAKSKLVWTEIDGVIKYIILKSISVEENQEYNGIFVAKLSYTYSNNI